MARCAICENQLTTGDPADKHYDSEEHVFPRSVGGRRTVSGFICKSCNDRSGATWDAELAKQFHWLRLMFDVSRQQGETPLMRATTSARENITIGPAGKLAMDKPTFERREQPDGSTTYHIKGRSLAEVRKILEGLKRKHPQMDVDAEMARAQSQEAYLSGPVNHALQFGGEMAGRSTIKTCLAWAFSSGVDWRACAAATSYLRNQGAEAPFGYVHVRDLVLGRMPGMPLNCVAVRADPASGLVLAYVEYFGINRIVACLGEGYAGPVIESVYGFDPRNGAIQQVAVQLDFDRSDIDNIYDYKFTSAESAERVYSAVIGPLIDARFAAEQKRVVEIAVDKAFREHGPPPGEAITEDQLRKLTRSMAESVAPFLLHRLRPLRKPGDEDEPR